MTHKELKWFSTRKPNQTNQNEFIFCKTKIIFDEAIIFVKYIYLILLIAFFFDVYLCQ